MIKDEVPVKAYAQGTRACKTPSIKNAEEI
jgi:hypothetical protein